MKHTPEEYARLDDCNKSMKEDIVEVKTVLQIYAEKYDDATGEKSFNSLLFALKFYKAEFEDGKRQLDLMAARNESDWYASYEAERLRLEAKIKELEDDKYCQCEHPIEVCNMYGHHCLACNKLLP